MKPLYKTDHYKTIFEYDGFKVDPKSVVAKQKCIDYREILEMLCVFFFVFFFF